MDTTALDPDQIGFRKLQMSDLPLMHRWLNTEYVRRWYGPEPRPFQEVERTSASRITGDAATVAHVMLYGARPIGYIQTYRIADYPDATRHVLTPEDARAASVDLFIGESACVHQRMGAPILRRCLRDVVFRGGGAPICLIGPALDDAVAIRADDKTGFRHVRTVQVPDEPVPEYLTRIAREDVLGASLAVLR